MQPPLLPGECRVPGGLIDEAAGRIRTVFIELVAFEHQQVLVADVFVHCNAGAGLVAEQYGGRTAIALVIQPLGGHARAKRLPAACFAQFFGFFQQIRMTIGAVSVVIDCSPG